MALPQSVLAYDFSYTYQGKTLYYSIISPTYSSLRKVCVSPLSNNYQAYVGGAVSIPDYVEYNGITYNVVAIANHAFRGCYTLSAISIPNTVNNIGQYAFYGCSQLSSINIPNTVNNIGKYTFAFCNHLTSVIIPDSVTTIDIYAFEYSGLTSVTIGKSVTNINSGAFRSCTSLTEINSNAIVAPILGSENPFYEVQNYIQVNIPCGSFASYQSNWTFFSNFIEPNVDISIAVNTMDNTMGQANILSGPNCDSTALVEAIPYYGYHFNHWNDGDTNNPRTITLTQDTAFTAYFEKNSYTVTVLSNNAVMGHVTGSDTVLYLDSVTISATPNYGYHFVRWNDNNAENPRTVQVTQDKTYTAIFTHNQYSINLSVDTILHGAVSGAGCYNYLSTCSITANANYGYHFTQWNDGNTDNPRIVILTQDTTFTANFNRNEYQLTLYSNDSTIGTVSGSGTYRYLDTVQIEANVIAEHYHFLQWSDANRENPRQYVVTGDASITAYFAIDTHIVNVAVNDITRGMVETTGTEFVYGTPCTVTATAYTGYTFYGWSNGVTANPYTFAVVGDVELTALFVAEGEDVYTVTVESADPTMGHASGGGQALSGGTVTIRAIPNEGYRFLNWQDGNTENPRVVTVTSDITYTAYFESTTQGIFNVDEYKITVYPNPTNGIVTIDADDVIRIGIYSSNGQMVKIFLHNNVIDISSLPSGVYTLRVETIQTAFVCRVIKK